MACLNPTVNIELNKLYELKTAADCASHRAKRLDEAAAKIDELEADNTRLKSLLADYEKLVGKQAKSLKAWERAEYNDKTMEDAQNYLDNYDNDSAVECIGACEIIRALMLKIEAYDAEKNRCPVVVAVSSEGEE